jgi:hypothetical protein
MNSTLGKYAPVTAAIAGVSIIGAYLIGNLLALPGAANLEPIALIAVGAIFGSAVVANGHKEPLRQAAVANARLDAIGAPHSPVAACPVAGCVMAVDHSGGHLGADGHALPNG